MFSISPYQVSRTLFANTSPLQSFAKRLPTLLSSLRGSSPTCLCSAHPKHFSGRHFSNTSLLQHVAASLSPTLVYDASPRLLYRTFLQHVCTPLVYEESPLDIHFQRRFLNSLQHHVPSLQRFFAKTSLQHSRLLCLGRNLLAALFPRVSTHHPFKYDSSLSFEILFQDISTTRYFSTPTPAKFLRLFSNIFLYPTPTKSREHASPTLVSNTLQCFCPSKTLPCATTPL